MRRHLTSLVLIAAAAAVAGCGPKPQPRSLPVWALDPEHGGRPARAPRPRGGIRGQNESSDLVVAVLQDSGLRFGTDGRMRSLWGYLRDSHRKVSPERAQPGDVVFFRTRAPGNDACDDPDHAGLVAAVETRRPHRLRRGPWRHHPPQLRRSAAPAVRRDESGRVLNSFLRPRKFGDPDDTPTFAGEMLCAVVRPKVP